MEKIKLEQKNLKINSDNWEKHINKNGQKYLENPTGDVWEYKSNQYFTWDGAMREAKKLGKRLPTNEEMEELEKEDYGEIKRVGFRFTNGSFGSLGAYEQFWSSTESGSIAWLRHLASSDTAIYTDTSKKTYGLSVRCVQE